MDTVLQYLKDNGVICKMVKDTRPEYGDFIAVFGYGNLTKKEIIQVIKSNNLLCIFFKAEIRKNEHKKKMLREEHLC